MATRLDANDPGFEAAFQALLETKRETGAEVDDVVRRILEDVRLKGDEAVIATTREFDGFELTAETMAVTADEIEAAKAASDKDVIGALELAAGRIADFHKRQIPDGLDYTDDAGLRLGYRWTPLAAVGLYVPGGRAAYPSSVLMNAVPARIAGVERLAMVVPAPKGEINPLVLAAASLAGIQEIYRIGGAQAVAAPALGTASRPPPHKPLRPRPLPSRAAKRQVFGTVGIDMIAGPSEILVLADGLNDPAWIAADLLSQAEHDESAQAILITDDGEFADRVVEAVESHMPTLPRAETAGASWRDFGAVIVVPSLTDALPLIDRLAPDHLEIATEDPDTLAAGVHTSGATVLRRSTASPLGALVP